MTRQRPDYLENLPNKCASPYWRDPQSLTAAPIGPIHTGPLVQLQPK